MKMADNSPNEYKTLGKGEISHYEEFLLFQQCFLKICTVDTQGLVWERVKEIPCRHSRGCISCSFDLKICQNVYFDETFDEFESLGL